jgi:hypothetical protein
MPSVCWYAAGAQLPTSASNDAHPCINAKIQAGIHLQDTIQQQHSPASKAFAQVWYLLNSHSMLAGLLNTHGILQPPVSLHCCSKPMLTSTHSFNLLGWLPVAGVWSSTASSAVVNTSTPGPLPEP